ARLRLRRRRGAAPPGGGAPGRTSRRRLPRVAPCRAPRRGRELDAVILRPFLNDDGSCASYLFGCTTHRQLAVVDAHADLVEEYLAAATAIGSPITAVFETHVQADHVSGRPSPVEPTGAPPHLPARGAGGCDHA